MAEGSATGPGGEFVCARRTIALHLCTVGVSAKHFLLIGRKQIPRSDEETGKGMTDVGQKDSNVLRRSSRRSSQVVLPGLFSSPQKPPHSVTPRKVGHLPRRERIMPKDGMEITGSMDGGGGASEKKQLRGGAERTECLNISQAFSQLRDVSEAIRKFVDECTRSEPL